MDTTNPKPRTRQQKVASVVRRFYPALADLIEAYWFRKHTRRWHWSQQLHFASKLYGDRPITVLAGPFRGMIYENRVYFGPITPRWVGSYEMELHPAVEEIATGDYQTIVDIGSAEGYYSIGLARRLPDAQVYSFDTDLVSRWQQKRLARLNRVTNLQLGGFCNHHRLDALLRRRSCVICDIEGWEVETLDPAKVPNLMYADILVEIHPFKDISGNRCAELFEERFRETHSIQRIGMESRSIDHFRESLASLNKDEAMEAMNEHRGREQEWLWLRSRLSGNGGSR